MLKDFINFIGVLFLLLLSTGWFLIPEYFNYVIITAIVLDLLGLLSTNGHNKLYAIIVSLGTIYNICALHYEWLKCGYLIVGTLGLIRHIMLYCNEEDLEYSYKPRVFNKMSNEQRENILMPKDISPEETLIEKFVKFNDKVIISEYEDNNKKTHYHIDLADTEEDTKAKFIDLVNQSLEWIHTRQKNEKKTTILDFYVTLCQPFDIDKLNKIWEEPEEDEQEEIKRS